MFEDNINNFFDSLNMLDEALKNYRVFKEHRSRFTNELIEIITALTYRHFTTKTSYPHLNIRGKLDKNVLRQNILTDEDFKYYGIWIFEELAQIIIDFSDDERPAGIKRYYKKIKYPFFTEKTLEEQIKEFEKEFKNLTPSQRSTLHQSLKEEVQIEEFYTNFKTSIHKALKKLALEYFPELPEITGNGIREIDYMLYTYMLMINENVMSILEDAAHISVYPS